MDAQEFEAIFTSARSQPVRDIRAPIEVKKIWYCRHDDSLWEIMEVRQRFLGWWRRVIIRPVHAMEPTLQLSMEEFCRKFKPYEISTPQGGSWI
jgi:hypothetical protein